MTNENYGVLSFRVQSFSLPGQGVGSDSNSDGGGEYSSDGGGGGDGDGLMVVNICLQTPPAPPWFCSLHPCCVMLQT